MQKLLSYMRSAVQQYNMIEEGDRIAVGLSGGKDSVAMLAALGRLRSFYPKKFDLVAITLDMRFDDKDTDCSALEELCKELDVPYVIKRTQLAKIVFESGIPILMAGLNVTEKALILTGDFERIRSQGNPVSDIVWQWLEFFYRFHRSIGYEGAPMHDPCAVMALIHPEIFTMRDFYVQIETYGDYCKGATVPDWYGVTGHAPNATCIMDVDRKAFADLLVEAIRVYGEVKT
jgi:hypothetical protein